MRFFEGGMDGVPAGQTFYSTKFAAAQSRYIFWELNLVHANPHERYDFTIHAVGRIPMAAFGGEQDINTFFESGWTSSERTLGWGDQTAGSWRPGTYTVELYIRNSLLATRSFEIY